MASNTLQSGILLNSTPLSISEAVENAKESGYEFLIFPSRSKKSQGLIPFENIAMFKDKEFLLGSSKWSNKIGVSLSKEDVMAIDRGNSEERQLAEDRIDFDLGWVANSSFSVVLLPFPGAEFDNYARLMTTYVRANPGTTYWMRVPFTSRGWDRFNDFRALCGYVPNLGILLEIGKELPDINTEEKFEGDILFCIQILEECFVQLDGGKIVELMSTHVPFIRNMIAQKVHFLLDESMHAGCVSHLKSISFRNPLAVLDNDASIEPFYDVVQSPLQPLSQNLESQVYEIFEKDGIKYQAYEEAMFRAVKDIVEMGRATELVVMVLGAGRGPLIDVAIKVLKAAGIKFRIYAVEKNVYAHMLLDTRKKLEDDWMNVFLINEDMRLWKCEDKADIILSELLGSFGDNELSPECLDAAQGLLKDGGIYIPDKYNSYLAPVSCLKVYNTLLSRMNYDMLENWHVVKMRRHMLISVPEVCFSFNHPSKVGRKSNERFVKIEFTARTKTMLHGFAGYFDAHLYGGVSLSIHPFDHTEGLVSWFECFFPIAQPLQVKEGETIEVVFWRKTDEQKIWYEWAVKSPVPLPIHNSGGKKQNMSLLI